MKTAILLLAMILLTSAGCSRSNVDKTVYMQQGLKQLRQNNISYAAIAFQKAVELDSSYFEARYLLASAYILQKKYKSAKMELLKVLHLSPSFRDTHLLLARVYLHEGRSDDAREEIHDYQGHDTGITEADSAILSDALAGMKGPIEAVNSALYGMNEDLPRLPLVLAEMFIESGDLKRAEAILSGIHAAGPVQ